MPVEMITERVRFIPGGVNLGIILGDDGSCAMVDTGLNETNAKKALKAIAQGSRSPVSLILTTHAHADHFGGNATVVRRTGAAVWAPPVDEAVIRNPILQPSLLFAGADPPPQLRGGFLLADASPVDRVIDQPSFEFEGVGVEVVELAGHSPGQIGFLVDGVFFCADVVLPVSVLEKYRIPYLYSVGEHIQSLDRALATSCDHVIPGHGQRMKSIEPAVSMNRNLVERVAEFVLSAAREPKSGEELFLEVLEHFDAPIADASGYFLLHPSSTRFSAT